MRSFRVFLESSPSPSVINAHSSDLPFLKNILDDAKNAANPIIFADHLEERGNELIATYLRTKINRKKPEENKRRQLIPIDNYFFQGIKQRLWQQRVVADNSTFRGSWKVWGPIINSRQYVIGGRKLIDAEGSYMINYSPSYSLFYHVQHGGNDTFAKIESPSLLLHWLMAVNALYLEGVFG